MTDASLLPGLPEAPYFAADAEGPVGARAHWVLASDGIKLRLVHWPLAGAKGTVLIFTGRTEYAEKYGRAAADLAARGYACVTLDWRGQGLSQRVAGDPALGHVGHFADYQRDVQALLGALPALGVTEPLFLVAHSMGGAIGLRALHDGLPVKACAFTAPMWGIRLSAAMEPLAWGISWLAGQIGHRESRAPGTKAETYVLWESFEANQLTHDRDMFDYMRRYAQNHPEALIGGPSMGWLLAGLRETFALAKMPSPDLPCVTFLGEEESIVSAERITARMARWPKGELVMVPDAYHEVMMEGPEIRTRAFDRCAALFDAQS
ncbi:alpha/beta hydrolase [Pseudooceanicola sp. CBS1P-1]|uniref:Alpha/beta fold hydrolase n=1 Tax=Pseudooceanicola albus TaxID=2692189 RepID=A0A6L7G1I6_9RHOB|nr:MULTISPECIES: alpha/beta hydrolase [Pseudooceanicola]MBT9383718.1 alpha/beta hydrolase [Pseudooceanicola endophyticus]MXN17572.1 alpha/beta fold hydrolase [Pseudooceanicola albus]